MIDAGPRANEPAANAGRARPFEIRKIEIADVVGCIQGVRDFGRAPQYGMFFGAIYAIGGLMIVWFAFAMDYPHLAYPLTMDFVLFPLRRRGDLRGFPPPGERAPLSWPGVTIRNPLRRLLAIVPILGHTTWRLHRRVICLGSLPRPPRAMVQPAREPGRK